jgi:Flp pilus assembly protein TadD
LAHHLLVAAQRTLKRAIKLKPDHVSAHYNLAVVLLQAGDATAAQPHLRRAAALGQSISPEVRAAAGL